MKHLQMILFVSLAICGAVLTRHYGESWDELQFYKYAEHALGSYNTWLQHGEIIVSGNTYDNYGPAFVIFTAGAAQFLHSLHPGWLVSDYRHLVYFFTFLAGVWAFHDIAQRWMSRSVALIATLLFLTQPLFWGHAFFSPKDIPFMSLFLLSVAFGFKMVDSIQRVTLDSLEHPHKRTFLLLTALWLVTVFGLFLGTGPTHAWIESLVRAAASGEANIISRIASDIHRVEPEVYVERYFVLFIQLRAIYFYLSTCLVAFAYYRLFPSSFALLRSVIPAGLLLGLASSTRILGPLAGLIVVYYGWHSTGKKILPASAAYTVIALMMMYATWPYLWPDPPMQLLESFQVMSQYPWKGEVLFNGQYYPPTKLPLTYIPLLLLLQFTEPVWLLLIIGLFSLRWNNTALVTTLLWFVLPLLALIATRAPLYDNTRQIFFILPPVFLLAGLGLETVFAWASRPAVRAGIAGLLILPGIVAGIRLHPYEYVYYNILAGDPTDRFELDYWGTSYREAAKWFNEHAPADAQIVAGDPVQTVELYLREDLSVIPASEFSSGPSDYAVYSTRSTADRRFFMNYETLHEIGRDGLIFAVIKKIK
jgi:hypothetical protein